MDKRFFFKATAVLDERGTVLDSWHQALCPPNSVKHATSLAIENEGISGRDKPEWGSQARKKPQHKATVSVRPPGTQGSVTGA